MKFSQLLRVFALGAIATFDLIPVFAQIENSPSNSLPARCRATKVDTPIFPEPSTSSNTIRILPRETKVSLAYIPASGDQFVRIQSPTSGFIQTAVLKLCNTTAVAGNKPWDKPTINSVCRQIVRPETGVVIRREPSARAAYITTIYPNTTVFVNFTTGNVVKSYRDENYIWAEIDLSRSFPRELSGNGWIVNTNLANAPELSNLGYCS